MTLLLKLSILLLLGLLAWLVFTAKPFAVLSVAGAVLCLAKSLQAIHRRDIP